MTTEDIRTLYYTKPFQPFDIKLADGRKFRIPQRHFVAISPTHDSITIGTQTGGFVFVEIEKVASLEVAKARRRKRSA